MKKIPELSELLEMFAMSEVEQETYWPRSWKPVWFRFGDFDTEAQDVRFLALCALAYRARQHEEGPDKELSTLCSEITGLAHFMIESSATWPWLMWHPYQVRTNEGPGYAVDDTLYRIWDVLRRLCVLALQKIKNQPALRPFEEVFDFAVVL